MNRKLEIIVTFGGNVKLGKLAQKPNPVVPIDVTLSWIFITDKLLHLLNKESSIRVTFGGIVKFHKLMHELNR